MKKLLPSLALTLLMLGCTTTHDTGTAGTAAAQTGAPTPSGARNLQVLPRDIPRDQLIAIMRTFTRSLGVRCNHCHVVTATEPKEELDFAADTKEEKRVARVMIRMTRQINDEWLERVEEAEGHHETEHPAAGTTAALTQPRVGCWTCHRGRPEPELPPPPPAQQQQAAPPATPPGR